MKYYIEEVIVVEGKYDLNKLRQIFESPVLATGGFGIYKKKDLMTHLDALSRRCGILILTDGDAAGTQIRNAIKGRVGGRVLHAYIPDVFGKEKRKSAPSAEGKLGVEGMDAEVILEAVRHAGATFRGEDAPPPLPQISRTDLYEDDLLGGDGSAALRAEFLRLARLPAHLNVTSLLEAINGFLGREEYETLRDTAKKNLEIF